MPPQTLPVPEGAMEGGCGWKRGPEWEHGLSPGPLGGLQHCMPTSTLGGYGALPEKGPCHPTLCVPPRKSTLGAFEAGTAHRSDHLLM